MTHSSVIYQILADMDNDWRASIHVEQHLHLMTTKANVSHFFLNTVFSFTTVAAASYLLGDYALHFLHLAKNVSAASRQLPLKVQFPFEHSDESPTYELLFAILFLHGMLNAYSLIILDTLILSLVSVAYLPPRDEMIQRILAR